VIPWVILLGMTADFELAVLRRRFRLQQRLDFFTEHRIGPE